MITSMDIYWIMQMDSIWKGFMILGVVLLVTAGILLGNGLEDSDRKLQFYSVPIAFLGAAMFIAAFMTPSTKTLAAMYTVPAVVNSEKAAKLGTDSIEVLELGLERLKEVLKKETP